MLRTFLCRCDMGNPVCARQRTSVVGLRFGNVTQVQRVSPCMVPRNKRHHDVIQVVVSGFERVCPLELVGQQEDPRASCRRASADLSSHSCHELAHTFFAWELDGQST